jgi:hypothetical protein
MSTRIRQLRSIEIRVVCRHLQFSNLGPLQSVRLQFQQRSPYTLISGRSHIFPEGECAIYLRPFFRKEQRPPEGELPDFGDYIPCASTVASTLTKQAAEARLDDIENVLPAAMKVSGGMCCDGLKKKRTGLKFYDLSLRFFKITTQHGLGTQDKVILCNRTLFVTEHAPGNGDSALAIRQTVDSALGKQFSGLSLESLNQAFTFVTDWAATMPRVVGASVSEKLFPLSWKWAGFVVHQLDTCLGCALKPSRFQNMEEEIVGVVMDVRNMKKVIEGVKRADLNHCLPRGCALFQEVNTRFHRVQDVAARFINALPYIRKLIDDGLAPESVNTAMGEIKVVDMMRTEDSQSLSAPRFLALLQVFKPVVEAMVKLQASQSLTLHLFLPLLTHIISKLFFIQRQSQEQVTGNEEAHSSCIQAMAAHLARVLLDKVVLHPVHAAAAILHPNLRDLSSFSRLGQRRMKELRVRALGVLDLAMRDTPTGKDLAEKSQEAAAVSSALVREPAAAPGTSSTFSLVNCFDLSTAPDEGSPESKGRDRKIPSVHPWTRGQGHAAIR